MTLSTAVSRSATVFAHAGESRLQQVPHGLGTAATLVMRRAERMAEVIVVRNCMVAVVVFLLLELSGLFLLDLEDGC